MNNFETRTNAARETIGKPPVGWYGLSASARATLIGELFASACDHEIKVAQELRRITDWVAHRQKMASWDAYSGSPPQNPSPSGEGQG